MHFLAITAIACLLLIGCATDLKNHSKEGANTDTLNKHYSAAEKLRNRLEIRDAFNEYLKYTNKNDKNRLSSLSRLAEIEIEIGNLLLEESDSTDNAQTIDIQNLYTSQLDKAISLFKKILREYPRAINNDDALYQISRLLYLKNNHEQSIHVLNELIKKYPKSVHRNEALFRLAEDHYTKQNYNLAEQTYTKIINANNNSDFYEKSLFKRGWSRLKTQRYNSAMGDFIAATAHHKFSDTRKHSRSENEQFKEYFRAIGISFSYIDDVSVLSNHFKRHPDFKHISHTYSVISDVYQKQQRYTDASNIIKHFILNYPDSNDAPHAHLKMITTLQEGGFLNRVNEEIENFYLSYNPENKYWKRKSANVKHTKSIQTSLRYYMLLIASSFHNKYQTNKKESDFLAAQVWYKRFLKHYNAHAHRGNVYYLYAELLAEHNDHIEAVKYYELAAYDSDLVLNKDAAYATIVLTNRLYENSSANEKNSWLDKHIHYSFLFYQMYPDHKHSNKTVIHAAELAYSSKKYKKAIELAELITSSTSSEIIHNANIIKAPAYFNIKKYGASEAIYTEIINYRKLNNKSTTKALNRLALSIYRQGEIESKKGNIDAAAHHFLRVSERAGQSNIAPTAMYDAIALFMSNEMWADAISTIKQFQGLYPNHKNSNDVTKKLSVAYLKSNQDIKAAHEFEKISSFEKKRSIKMSALWQAAEIYENKNHLASAIRSFTKYVNSYSSPYPQYIEAMHKLSKLYTSSGDFSNSRLWLSRMSKADKKAPGSIKTDRTKSLVSQASLSLARITNNEFNNIRLIAPLKSSLRKKKKAMQQTIKLYGQSSSYGFQEITTEATYAIAKIYSDFSTSLLESERPANLNEDELEQYEILLEDQAFPFEEKAIEFFEANMSHTKDGINNKWTRLSHSKLKEIFPVRYKREEKIESYINVIH